MATITKSFSNLIVVQCDNTTQPAYFSSWTNANVTYSADYVQLNIEAKGYRFTSDWSQSPCGLLTDVNGIDVSTGYTNEEIANIIKNNVLTDDKFSGDPLVLSGTTMVSGQFTAIHFDTDTVLDVSDSAATVMVDGNGDAISVSNWTGVVHKAGDTIYGKFSQVQLVSGNALLYSNL